MRYVAVVTALAMLLAECFVETARAQETASYFPYVRGDSAVFEHVPGSTHTVWVSAELEIADRNYLIVNGIQGRRSPDTLRVHGAQVYRLDHGIEQVLYDFGLPDGSLYSVSEGPFADYQVLVTRGHTATVPAGKFDDVVHLYFDIPGPVDDEWLYAFAPGVGLVWHSGAWGGGALVWARIGGVIITSVEEPVAPTGQFDLYPSPAATTVIVSRTGAATSPAVVTIYDVLGRRCGLTLLSETTHSTTSIDISHLAPGIYLAQFQTERTSLTRTFVVVH